MGKILNNWLVKPIYIYSFGLFFLIYKTAQYFQSFELSVFILLFLIYCAINYLVLLLLKMNYNYSERWLLFFWIVILFSSTFKSFISDVLITPSFARIRYIAILTICIGFLFARIKLSNQFSQFYNYFINIFVFILTGLVFLSGIQTYLKEQRHAFNIEKRQLPSVVIRDKRDVVWILLDEYTAPASLRSQFNVHDPLVDSLKAKSFFVFDSLHSRNDITIYAVNSLFNLDDSIAVSNYMYAANYLKKSMWIDKMKHDGYAFVSLDFFNIADQPKFFNIKIFTDNYIDQILDGSIIGDLWYNFIKGSKRYFDDYNQYIINKLTENISTKKHPPTFVWIHLLIPHPPFYRDAAGNINNSAVEDVNNASPVEISKQYINYLSYSNGVALKILNQIPDWKNKVIVISGDHGARMIIPKNDPRRKTPFAAIYYPGMDTTRLKSIKYLQQIPFYLH